MNRLLQAVAVLLLAAPALAAEAPPPIYDADPHHLANRLYAAMAIRTEAGTRYGIDGVTAFREPFDDSAQVAMLADELVARKDVVRSLSELKRALLLHDVWTAFDIAVSFNDRKTLRSLAAAVRALAMDAQSLARLPDNYADAIRSGAFARDFDPEQPDRAFLPPDLFEPRGPWIQIGEMGSDVVAPLHVSAAAARSAFMIFVRCPGGREATLRYLNSLNLYRAPFTLTADPIGTLYHPNGNRPVRANVVQFNPQTPQFPAGTVFALVRQMMVVDDALKPVATKITQSVQFRIYHTTDFDYSRDIHESFARSQRTFEMTLTRRDLLAGRAGGLHQLADDEAAQDLTGNVGMEWTRAQRLRGPVVMSTCGRCHSGPGIFSVNAYNGFSSRFRSLNPALMPAEDADYQQKATVRMKTERFDWGLLQGILAEP